MIKRFVMINNSHFILEFPEKMQASQCPDKQRKEA